MNSKSWVLTDLVPGGAADSQGGETIAGLTDRAPRIPFESTSKHRIDCERFERVTRLARPMQKGEEPCCITRIDLIGRDDPPASAFALLLTFPSS